MNACMQQGELEGVVLQMSAACVMFKFISH